MGSHSLLQGIFLTQGLNLGLLDCRQILYCLSHQAQYQSQDGDSDGVTIDLIHILPVLHELVHADVCVCVCVCVCVDSHVQFYLLYRFMATTIKIHNCAITTKLPRTTPSVILFLSSSLIPDNY